jgi:O-antigen/teichoic acid export membrane protein
VLSVLRFGFPFVLGIGVSIVLTKILIPAQFGVYAIFGTITPVLAIIIGSVAVAFVVARQFTAEDINAVFWTMEAVSILIGGAIVAAGLAGMASVTVNRLLVTLGVFLPLIPMRFPADISFYRQIRMDKLALVEASEVTAYQAVAVACAYAGLGSLSFGIGLDAGAFVAVLVNFSLARWRPQRPAFAGSAHWLRIGLPYMLNSSLVYAKERASFILLAAVAGAATLGLFSWAYTAAMVLVTLTLLATQGLYGLFAQIRDDQEAVGRVISIVLRLIAVGTFGFSACLAGSIRPLITTVFSPLWLPATHCFWLLLIASSMMSLAAPLQSLAAADGRVHLMNRWLLVQIAIIWIVGIPAAILSGPGGFALCFVVGAFLFLALIYRSTAARYQVEALTDLVLCAVAGIGAAGCGFAVANSLGRNWLSLAASAGASLLVYCALTLGWRRRQIFDDTATVFELIRRRA